MVRTMKQLSDASVQWVARKRHHQSSTATDCTTGNSRMRVMRKLPVVPLCRRPSVLLETPNQQHLSGVPFPQEGRFAVVTDVGSGMRWTLWLCVDERSLRRTAKSCGSGAPKQALSSRRCSRVSRVTVATKRWSPRRARISRKTIAQGRPDVSGASAVNTRVHTKTTKRTRGCGCIGHPAFPAPSFISEGLGFQAQLGRNARRECGFMSCCA